jgi:hypothetical protein
LAEYRGLNVGVEGTATLAWIIFPNPHRPGDKVFGGRAFVFRDVSFLKITGRHGDLPLSEDQTLHGISRVLPGDLRPYLMSKQKEWTAETAFHLLFEFRGGLAIEVGAAEAEFVALPKGEAH